jgi:glycolate oxidase
MLMESGAPDILIADSPTRLKNIWAARSSFLVAIKETTKLLDECDVVVPVAKIAEYMAFVNEAKVGYDFAVRYFGHAGDGNLHIYAVSGDMEKG